ncbi:hypothetical protein DH2020_028353 [Rehmannia glutinosa]|uniref:Shugoshin C-terminal domain-containing protein n=1 Tax=Rehmannia glutinosa TaxID=99300 RepID=A0ABR0VUC3_REHGL
MPNTEGFLILDSQNAAPIGDKAGKAAGPCPQSVARRKLADISNLPQKPRPLIQDDKSQSNPTTTKAYIEQLQKLKALQHELGCKNGLLKARNLELEVNLTKLQEEGETSTVDRDDEKPRNTKRRLRSHSEPLTRRQSARFKAADLKHAEDLSEKDETKLPKCPLPDEPFLENGSTSGNASVENEDNGSSLDFRCKSQDFGRSSLGRPSRLATKKVQSYKEISIKVKMRRSE